MILIQYNDCGQSYDKDVGEMDVTRQELLDSVARCQAADDIEDVDMNRLDNYVFWFKHTIADLLSYDRDDVYCLMTNNDSSDASLFYVGTNKHYGSVVGAIKAHQRYSFNLPEAFD